MFRTSTEVEAAIAAGRPVVALESTLVAHGLPWPANLETARAAEAAVRAAGAVPATVALLGGEILVGLSDPELEHLARAGTYRKLGRRDLSAAAALGLDGATTVSATLWVARKSGLRAMATGGLGGVHRGDGSDVSADLDELAAADGMLVVCSGVKTILDVPATLEALETRGVAVVGYGTDALPGFTARSTGLPLEWRVDTPDQAAAIVAAHRRLGLPGAIVLARPVDEADAVDEDLMASAIAQAEADARASGLSGKALTPFLLARVREATGGLSLSANRSLIVGNAALAGAVAARGH